MAFEIEHGVLKKYIPEDGETEVVIPERVTRIEDFAFDECTSLTSVTIPEGVTRIGDFAFGECKSLTSVTIPEGVTRIGNRAFHGCVSLTGVTIPKSATSIGDGAFEVCMSLTSVTIPEGVKNIGNGIFDGCRNLTAVIIPKTVTGIGDHAFCECKSLKNVIIQESVTSIGRKSFCGCRSLKNITIPESVTWIGDDAFYGCRSIRMFSITFAPKAFKEKNFTNAIEMLKTGDFSMKISTDIKYAAAVAFWMKTEDEAAEAFIRKNISRIMAFLIEHDNTDAVRKLLESGKFITKKNIDKFITSAIKHTQNGGNMEIQTMLMHYKAEVIGYKDPAAQFKL